MNPRNKDEIPWSVQVDEMLEQERLRKAAKEPPAPKTVMINFADAWRKWFKDIKSKKNQHS